MIRATRPSSPLTLLDEYVHVLRRLLAGDGRDRVPIRDAGPDTSPDSNGVPLAQPCASPAATKPFEFIGYREMRAHIESGKPLPETIAAIAQATRHYAKRQLTWFRKEPGVHWFSGFGDAPEILAAASAEIAQYLAGDAAPPLAPLAKY